MLRLEAVIEGFKYTIQINRPCLLSRAPVTNTVFVWKIRTCFKNLNSLTSQLSTIYVRTY